MDVHVRIRWGCSKPTIEPFGQNRFIIHAVSNEHDSDAFDEVVALVSRATGRSRDRIELRRDNGKDKVFFVN